MRSQSHVRLAAETLPSAYLLVLDILRGSPTPISAYALLEQCRDKGLKTPVQVYRILDRLIAFKLVHRIEKMKAYVACQICHVAEDHAVFAICDLCGRATELAATDALETVGQHTLARGFTPISINIEIFGRCEACAPAEG
jgi:Fur family transcriptional regulator, zinc uptake regulator